MKLGVLLCGHVPDNLQAEFEDYQQMFTGVLLKPEHIKQYQLQLVFYSAIDGKLPTHINSCDAYITSGSKFSVYDDEPWIIKLKDFVRTLFTVKKAFVGICFGHQLIACALGGCVSRAENGWGVGIADSQIIKNKNWMRPVQNNLALAVSHQDQVYDLPINAELLATNPFCPNSMFQVGDHFLAIQGHPEFSTKYISALIRSRKNIIPSKRLTQGLNSLIKTADDKLTIQWILQFLSQACRHSND